MEREQYDKLLRLRHQRIAARLAAQFGELARAEMIDACRKRKWPADKVALAGEREFKSASRSWFQELMLESLDEVEQMARRSGIAVGKRPRRLHVVR
jgi:hypothetical protein